MDIFSIAVLVGVHLAATQQRNPGVGHWDELAGRVKLCGILPTSPHPLPASDAWSGALDTGSSPLGPFGSIWEGRDARWGSVSW